MGLLADHQIKARLCMPATNDQRLVIRPFSEAVSEPGKVSWGLSSYGYDLRVGTKYLIFSDVLGTIVDPLTLKQEVDAKFRQNQYCEHEGPDCIIPPNSFVLAESLEYFEIPRDVSCVVLGKSTYARCGINLNMTPLEPEWRGVVTIEIANLTRLPARIHSNQGIGQVLFLKGDSVCQKSYADKRSRYQDQTGLELPSAR